MEEDDERFFNGMLQNRNGLYIFTTIQRLKYNIHKV